MLHDLQSKVARLSTCSFRISERSHLSFKSLVQSCVSCIHEKISGRLLFVLVVRICARQAACRSSPVKQPEGQESSAILITAAAG